MIEGDLLSAAALLITIPSILLGVWHSSITDALYADLPPHKEDRTLTIQALKAVRSRNLLPLLSFSALLTLALMPPAVRTVWESAMVIAAGSVDTSRYDPVAAIFLIAWAYVVGLTAYVAQLTVKTSCRLRQAQPPK